MQISPLALTKLDTRLRDVLSASGGAEGIRILLSLRAKGVTQENAPTPESYDNREDYRRALIEHRKRFVEESIGDSVRELNALGLRVIESSIMRTVIADGTAEQIIKALDLPAIEKAVLDRPLELIHIIPTLPLRSDTKRE